jgi:hypothetical protein
MTLSTDASASRLPQPDDRPRDRLPDDGQADDEHGCREATGQRPAVEREVRRLGGEHEQLEQPYEVDRSQQQAAEEHGRRPNGIGDELIRRHHLRAPAGGERRDHRKDAEAEERCWRELDRCRQGWSRQHRGAGDNSIQQPDDQDGADEETEAHSGRADHLPAQPGECSQLCQRGGHVISSR